MAQGFLAHGAKKSARGLDQDMGPGAGPGLPAPSLAMSHKNKLIDYVFAVASGGLVSQKNVCLEAGRRKCHPPSFCMKIALTEQHKAAYQGADAAERR